MTVVPWRCCVMCVSWLFVDAVVVCGCVALVGCGVCVCGVCVNARHIHPTWWLQAAELAKNQTWTLAATGQIALTDGGGQGKGTPGLPGPGYATHTFDLGSDRYPSLGAPPAPLRGALSLALVHIAC